MKDTSAFPINAREFHNFLGLKEVCASWIKSVRTRHLLKENVDFIKKTKRVPTGQISYDYWLSFPVAEKLARRTYKKPLEETMRYLNDVMKAVSPVPTPRSNTPAAVPVKPTQIGEVEVNAVDARELHGFLGSQQDFSTWIKSRINTYGFEEGVDFVTFHKIVERKEGVRGAAKTTDYTLTIDMAKELAMVERTERGRQARRYFIECERKLREITKTNPAEMLRMLADQLEAAGEGLAEPPAVSYVMARKIPWLDVYFKRTPGLVESIGIELTTLSEIMEKDIQKIKVTGKTWKTVNAYHPDVIEEFEQTLIRNPKFLWEYRK